MTAPVFYYHRVGPFRPGAPKKMTVLPERFREQMDVLKNRDVLSLDQVLAGKKGVAITFDDGFLDCMEFALPVLAERKLTATFFIVATSLGSTDAWNRNTPFPEERVMGLDDLKRLRDAGMEIGSHSLTHQTPLTRAEVVDSRRLLEEKLGVPVRHFAYPRGEWTSESAGWAKEAGYVAAWATKGGTEDVYARRRLPVAASATAFTLRAKIWKSRFGWYG
ncbi:MAG TPA: polysaccharide deacetylase family protein [Planctomycetota bacterium]